MSQSSSHSTGRPGRPALPAKNRLVHTGIRLGVKDRSQLALLAKREGVSLSEYLRRLVWAHIAARAA